MTLKSFITPMSGKARDEFAKRCGTTRGHLQNVMYGTKKCATNLAVSIERESKKEVRRWDLREDWRSHWPELITAVDAPPPKKEDHRAEEIAAAAAKAVA